MEDTAWVRTKKTVTSVIEGPPVTTVVEPF